MPPKSRRKSTAEGARASATIPLPAPTPPPGPGNASSAAPPAAAATTPAGPLGDFDATYNLNGFIKDGSCASVNCTSNAPRLVSLYEGKSQEQ